MWFSGFGVRAARFGDTVVTRGCSYIPQRSLEPPLQVPEPPMEGGSWTLRTPIFGVPDPCGNR